MTMLTHPRGPLPRIPSPSARPTPIEAGTAAADPAARRAAQPALIRQLFRVGLTILLAGGALAGIIALKTMVYFWRFNYY